MLTRERVSLEEMSTALAWSAGTLVFDRAFRAYIALLSDRLAELLSDARVESPAGCAWLEALLQDAGDAAFMRTLVAPETSFRLLWRPGRTTERVAFICNALRAESARDDDAAAGSIDRECWTALGDVGFHPGGERIDNPQVPGAATIDILSPHAAAVDLGLASGGRQRFAPDQLDRVLAKIADAAHGIEQAGAVHSGFVQRFNMVFIPQAAANDPTLFMSGSTGQYIGRSFVVNPHLDRVDAVDLAEAFVHEGIHALLYMQERQESWVNRPDYFELTQRIESPWTGRALGLRGFLHAVCVWYGLLHFWADALATRALSQPRVESRMRASLRGFLCGSLADRLLQYRPGVAADVLATVNAMQARVKAVA